jgi:Putative zinc-finger
MKCQEVSLLLEEYFDGELETEQSELVAAHLAACEPCAHAYEALQRAQDFLLRYERDVEVTPQLWRGVEARIAAAQEAESAPSFSARLRAWLANSLTVPRFSPALTAALVLVAVALTVGAMKLMSKHERETMAQVQTPTPVPTATNAKQNNVPPAPSVAPTQPQHEPTIDQAIANATPQPEPKKREEKRERTLTPNNGARIEEAKLNTPLVKHEPTPEDLVKDAEAKYQKAIEILQRDVNRRRPQIDQQTLARYDETLNAIDRTINETRRAALGQGNDPVAVQYMLTAYAKKVEVLREMARN